MAKRSFALMALVVGFGSTADYLGSPAIASDASHPLEAGSYLSKEYLDILRASRSAYKADSEAQHVYKVVSVRYDHGRCYVTPETFHEGGLDYFVSRDNILQPGNPTYPRPTHFKITSATSFELSFSPGQPVHYQYVDNVAKYVSAVVIVGRYVDSAGHVFEFRSDGSAVFPERKFTYEIGLDHVLTRFDYFYEPGKMNAVTPFLWDGDTLRLYTVRKQENVDVLEIDTTKPPLILHAAKNSK